MLKTYIINAYGEANYKKTTKLQHLSKKAANAKNQWIFLKKCHHHRVIPKSFRTRPTLLTKHGKNITFKYNLQMLKATENTVKKKYNIILVCIKEVKEDLKNIFEDYIF